MTAGESGGTTNSNGERFHTTLMSPPRCVSPVNQRPQAVALPQPDVTDKRLLGARLWTIRTLWYCFDPGMLVVDVQRRRHPLGEHSRPEPTQSLLGDSPLDDQLHLIGPSQV